MYKASLFLYGKGIQSSLMGEEGDGDMERQSKVVVITGASSGIGEAAAKLLGQRGDRLVLAARREDRLRELVAAIEASGGEAVYQVTDVTSREQVEALAQKAREAFGRIDVWVNNAGLMPQSTLAKKHVEEWDRMIDVNIKGVLYGIAAALPVMREQQGGQIINVSSVAGHHVNVGGSVYSATKFAVRAISEGLRQEEAAAGSNIRVTIISPGAVATELTSTITDEDLKPAFEKLYAEYAISAERVAETIAFAMDMPEDTAMNEIVMRPTQQRR